MKTQNNSEQTVIKKRRPLVLLILLSVYAVLYVFVIIDFIKSAITSGLFTTENIFMGILVILFTTGYVLAWWKTGPAGIVFILWYFLMWMLALFFSEKGDDSGMLIIMGLPLMIMAVFLILHWFKTNYNPGAKSYLQFRFVLRILILVYSICYLMFALSMQHPYDNFHLLAWPNFLLLFLAVWFLAGVWFSWKKEIITGIMFILWYAGLILLSAMVKEIGGDGYIGLYAMLGSTVFIQGMLSLVYWFKWRPRKELVTGIEG